MIRIYSILIIPIIALSFISCKGVDLDDLRYGEIKAYNWLQVDVNRKNGKRVMWFQVHDKIDKTIVERYKKSSDKIGKYHARIFEDKWIWILVNDRIEIRLIADKREKDFQNFKKLKKFLLSFDLDGLEKVSGKKLEGKELEQYIPKLGRN